MGGDAQDQWQAQFLMNYMFSNKNIDQALNEPRVSSEHLPAFFHPHDPNYKQLLLEERLAPLQSKLIKKGHNAKQLLTGVKVLYYAPERKIKFMMHMQILEVIKVKYFKHKHWHGKEA